MNINRRNILQLGLIGLAGIPASTLVPAVQTQCFGKYWIDAQSFYEWELARTGKLVGETFTVTREFQIPYKWFEIIDCKIIVDIPEERSGSYSYITIGSLGINFTVFRFKNGYHEGAQFKNFHMSNKNNKSTMYGTFSVHNS